MSDRGGRGAGLLRDVAPITAWNLAARVTGFARVLVVGAAVGTTFFGNTYQSANLVSNILFELLAAGVLSSVLVPAFVRHLEAGGRDDATRLAGAILGAVLAVLTPVVVAGLVLAPLVMRVLTLAVEDPAVRDEQIRVGAFFLWFFLPQVLLYAVGAVATGLVHADRRFAAPAAAPVANNLVLIAVMGAFWLLRDGPPSLDIPLAQRVLVGAGTTAGVLVMSAVPLVAAWRRGLRLLPRWEPRQPELRSMARAGAWAAGYLGLTQLLIGLTLVLANRVEGGAVAVQIAFTFFLLPYALVGNPIMTALFPRLASDVHAGAREQFASRLGDAVHVLAFSVLPASALLVAVARPLLDTVAFGALDEGGALVARTLAAYAVGLAGYAAFQLLTRAFYADGDTRTPTVVNLVVTAVGAVAMVAAWSATEGGDRLIALGLAHSGIQLAGAAALFAILVRRLPVSLRVGPAAGRAASASFVAGVAAWAVVVAFDARTRGGAATALVGAVVTGGAVYLVAQRGRWPAWRASGVRSRAGQV